MSIARHHTEWLSLVPVSGPFLSLPVLMEACNAGLESHDSDQFRLLRQEYGNWLESFEKRKADPAPHQHWIRFVLNKTLELDDKVLLEGQAIPQTLQVEVPEHHSLLRPNLVVIDPATKKPCLLVQTYPRSQELTNYVPNSRWKASPDTRMTNLLRATGISLGLVTNGEHWMLINALKDEMSGYASWYASLWLEEQITLRAFRTFLSASRFFGEPEKTLESLLLKSASNQQEVTDQLGYQVRRAVEVLIYSLDRADQDFGRELLAGIKEEVLYESALTVMMRLVFLFCAEERELIPSKPFPVYDQNYSVSTISKQLRELADQHGEELLERRYDAWPRLLAAFRALYGGLRHDDVNIPAYGGNLFNPDRFPFLEGRKKGTSWRDTEASPLPINNRTVLHLLEALQLLQIKMPGGGKAEARRLSFRALDIEQIGHVYEGLLDHTAKRAAEPFVGLAGSRNNEPEIPLAELEQFLAKGEADLIKYLKETTGKQEKAILKLLKVELDTQDVARFRTVCQGDDALWKRVQPFAGFIRLDNFGYPVVILPGNVFVTAGTDRRSTGTHYTPRSLTEPIVQYTLEPLVYVGPAEGHPKEEWKLKPAKELLDLKICDMACGSGAFLVQAARYMSERVLEAWEEAKQANPSTPGITPEGLPSMGRTNESLIPEDAAERKTYAMRLIAQRCLYGVDKNPLAVEMAKLSLWLLTVAKDKPFEFLDHSIRHGDSLVGLHNIDQLRHYSLKPEAEDAVLFKGPLDGAVDEAINLRLKLEDLPANTVEDVERQEKLLKEANEKIARLRCAADLLVAAEFWGGNAKDKLERVRHNAVRSGYYIEKGPTEEFEQVAAKDRQGQSMFHWCLEFPEVIIKHGGFDAFVGNPPFVGGRRIIRTFGEPYQRGLQSLFPFISANADYCTFFFHRAYQETRTPGYFSYLATKTISEGDTRESGLDLLTDEGAAIFRAYTSLPWPGSASVLISLIFIAKHGWHCKAALNDASVPAISNSLTGTESTSEESAYHLASRQSQVFQGCAVAGDGFLLTESEAEKLLAASPANSDVVRQYITGSTFCNNPDYRPTGWIIHFFDRSEDQAKKFKECFAIVEGKVKPYRMGVRRDAHRRYWWQFGDKRPAMFKAVAGLTRVLANARVAKFIAFDFLPTDLVYLNTLHIFPFDDSGHLALLQSTFHEAWALARISSVGVTPQYTPVDCFGTFPFPASSQVEVLNSIGSKYRSHRQSVMLENRHGLTETYNRFHDSDESAADIQALRDLHIEMDNAVAASYGWPDLELDHGFQETKQGMRFTISEPARREVLQRLLKLNHERYAEEVKQGLHDKKKGSAKKATPKKKATGKQTKDGATLFDQVEEDNE
jgi:hypothetical protein